MKQYYHWLIVLLALRVFFVANDTLAQSILVQDISITGNKKTKENIILRELTFAEGDSLPKEGLVELLEENRKNVYNVNLFNKVLIDFQEIDKRLYIVISVKERWYIFPSPDISWEERNSYDALDALRDRNFSKLSYGLWLGWSNVTGRNETLEFFGQFGFSERLYINFNRPYIIPKQKIDMRTSFFYAGAKSLIVTTDSGLVKWSDVTAEPLLRSYRGRLGFTKRFTVRRSLYAELYYKHYQFSDSIFRLNPKYIAQADGREYYPSLSLSYMDDKRDLFTFPLKGYRIHLFARHSGIPKISTSVFSKIGFSWAHHIPLSSRWNFAYGIHNILAIGNRIPYFEKNFIGLNRQEFRDLSYLLRGYEPYAIDGSFISMTKAEVKFAILPRRIIHLAWIPFDQFKDIPFGLYISSFSDLGYVRDDTFSNQDSFLKNKLLTGYGLGLNILSFYDYLLRIEYSRNHLNDGGIYFGASVPIK